MNRIKSLFEAVAQGQEDVVETLLESGVDVTTSDRKGFTPLALATQGGHANIVRLLIDAGADSLVDLMPYSGNSALGAATRMGSAGIVQALLDSGATVNLLSRNGTTALHQAVLGRHIDVARVLLDQGADVNARAISGILPLHYAIEREDEAMVELLLDRGADPNKKSCWYTSYLVEKGRSALELDTTPEIKRLLERAIAQKKYFDVATTPAGTCDYCRSSQESIRYAFHYGTSPKYETQSTDLFIVETTRFRTTYHIAGESSALICKQCLEDQKTMDYREYFRGLRLRLLIPALIVLTTIPLWVIESDIGIVYFAFFLLLISLVFVIRYIRDEGVVDDNERGSLLAIESMKAVFALRGYDHLII